MNKDDETDYGLADAKAFDQAFNALAAAIQYLSDLHDYCDKQCKEFPHKTAENYAYWDIQDRIATFFGREEKL